MDNQAIIIFTVTLLILIGLSVALIIKTQGNKTININQLQNTTLNPTTTTTQSIQNQITSQASEPSTTSSLFPPMSPELKQQLVNIYGRKYYDNCKYELRML